MVIINSIIHIEGSPYLPSIIYKGDDMMNKEIWKDISGYEGLYQVSNLGNIRKIWKFKTIMCKPSSDSHGYKQIVLTKDKKRKSYKVHRLVALTFINNPNNYEEVNHKDENKTNNKIDNLEWCDRKYNCNYGNRNYKCTRHRLHRIQQYNKENNLIGEYPSLKEAEKVTGIKYQSISSCCRNIKKSAGGYKWKYC